jgi:DNA-binding MarR family transcriptional regulator
LSCPRLSRSGPVRFSGASYTTIIVNELQALGLLCRTPDERDRRKKTVELTADGREAMRKAQAIVARPPSPLRDLPAADLLRLREILGHLIEPRRDPVVGFSGTPE